jgi:hypothetical protein
MRLLIISLSSIADRLHDGSWRFLISGFGLRRASGLMMNSGFGLLRASGSTTWNSFGLQEKASGFGLLVASGHA